MTAQGVISDAAAREIATGFGFAVFAATGEIGPVLLERIDQRKRTVETGRRSSLRKLRTYVSHHGERPAQDGWGEL